MLSRGFLKHLKRPHAAGRSRERPLDDVTLSRLTWLWLAYSIFALTAGGRGLPTVCPYRLMTRDRCPLCGLTTSIHSFMRGQISSSFEQHRAGPILYAGSAFLLASAWHSRWRTATAPRRVIASEHPIGTITSDLNSSRMSPNAVKRTLLSSTTTTTTTSSPTKPLVTRIIGGNTVPTATGPDIPDAPSMGTPNRATLARTRSAGSTTPYARSAMALKRGGSSD